jgi:hypothetical protein
MHPTQEIKFTIGCINVALVVILGEGEDDLTSVGVRCFGEQELQRPLGAVLQ